MKELMTITEVGLKMNVSLSTVRRWIKREWLKTVKIGKLIRITRESVEKLMREGKTWD